MSGFKDFSKASFKSFFWILLYFLSQTFSGMLLFSINLFIDSSFVSRFLELFAPIYDSKGYSIEKNIEVLNCFNLLLDNFLNEIFLISGILIIVLFLIISKFKNNEIVNKKINFSKKQFLLFFISGICFNIFISIGMSFIPLNLLSNYTYSINHLTSSNFWIINLIVFGIISPIVEEIIFRYGILGCFININPTLAIIYQAILFATIHTNPIQMVYTFIFALFLGYTTYNKNSIYPALILHIALNSSTILVSNLFVSHTFFGLYYCIFVLLVCFYIYEYFLKKGKLFNVRFE